MDINKKPIYPVETWNVTEKEFSMETNYRNETTFALSNFAAVFHVPTPTFPANGFDATVAPDISDLRSVVPAFLANIF